MLISLKKLKKTLLSKGKLSQYLTYALGEIVIVAIGILLALYLNNWNQNKVNNKLEKQYYQSIKDQLTEDLKILKGEIEYNRYFYIQYCYGIELIENNVRTEIDTLGKISFNMVRFSDFKRKSNIYQTLINSGEIVILKNKEITKGLESLEETYLYINRLEENHSTIIFSQIIQDLKEIIQLKPVKVLRPDLLYNYKVKNDFSILVILMNEINDVYDQGVDRLQKIISLIDKELSK